MKGKKIYLIRFIQADQNLDSSHQVRQYLGSLNLPGSSKTGTSHTPKENFLLVPAPSKFAKSVSLVDLLKAGRIIKKKAPEILHLEKF